jgi:hypothetical protein
MSIERGLPMPHRFVLVVAVVALVSSLAYSETFMATIIKVEGDKVTYKKATFHRDKAGTGLARYSFAEPVTAEATKDVAVTMGHFLPADAAVTSEGRKTGKTKPVEGGLSNDRFKGLAETAKPSRPSLITIGDKGSDKGKITAINLWSSAAPK